MALLTSVTMLFIYMWSTIVVLSAEWDPVQIEFLNKSQSVLNPDYPGLSPSLRYLLYFPGNSIYGWELPFENMHCGNGSSLWGEDIPGNMADPKYRRMVSGSLGWQPNTTFCPLFDLKILISIGPNAGGPWTVNDWFTLHVDTSKGLYVNVSTDSKRLKVVGDVLTNPANVKQSIARLEITDILEDNCYDALYDSHCVRWANDTSNMTATECDMCSVINHDALKKGNCTETRRRTVVKYWCSCDGDQDCGGPPPY